MNTQIETQIRRIEKTSKVLRGACTGFIAVSAATFASSTVAIAAGWATNISFFSESVPVAGLARGPRAGLAVLSLATGVVVIKALVHLWRLLENYSRREIFTAQSARQIRQFGISCMLWSVIRFAWVTIPNLLAPSTSHAVAFMPDAMAIGIVIVGISWFAELAVALREENDLTI